MCDGPWALMASKKIRDVLGEEEHQWLFSIIIKLMDN